MNWLPIPAQLSFALLVCTLAAISDLKTGLISNRLVVVALAVGIAFALGLGFMRDRGVGIYQGSLYCLAGAVSCAPLPVLLYALRYLGGGDTKLFIAQGVLLGPVVGLEAELYAFVLASLFGFGVLAYRGVLFQTLSTSLQSISRSVVPQRRRIPISQPIPTPSLKLAPIICVGMLVTFALHWSVP